MHRNSQPPNSQPDYLCIGHICHDIKVGSYILGGSASYSGICAARLGKKVGVITSYGEDFQFISSFKNISFYNKKVIKTTIFENVYDGNYRIQYLHQRAKTIYSTDLPKEWLAVPLVHICPIADEVDFSVIKAFSSDTLIVGTPQGWMRHWDKNTGKVSPKMIDWDLLSAIDILVLSEEDIEGHQHLFPQIIESIDIVVMTRGFKPASVFFEGKKLDFPVFPTKLIDPTGAGDTFATGFLVKYQETKDVVAAMMYGHVVASFCIEGVGLTCLKNREVVEKRYLFG